MLNFAMEFSRNGSFITLLFFTTEVVWGCLAKSMGVLLPTLRDQFTTETWIIGIVLALQGVTSDVAGPTFGIITVLDKVLLGRHFTTHFALACGIGHMGKGLALLVIAPLTQLFLDTYGWRGAALLIGGICMHLIPSAAVVQDVKPHYENISDESSADSNDQKGFDTDGNISLKASCLGICKAMDLGILLEFNFWIVFMCNFGLTCTFDAWQLYFVPHLQVKGFSAQVAASLCTAAAVGYLIGTVIWSPFIDRGLIKCSTAIIISSLALTFSFVVDPWVNDVIGYVIITTICGLFASALYTLIDVMTKDILGIDRLVSAFGWMRALFFGRLIAGFVPGWMYDARGSYDLAFVVIGIMPSVCLLPLVIGLMWKTF
ncbi:monocarboxylate transporter 12-like isoform X2 [Patiria miniata]|uniref:Major facilitator superfamily (MFS) profile domain-containing protein n=1 Tax=Patiria miniata TaxID=46514 RepID=A0A913ZHM2_PATMI|nr:monocarboxylate transporter 12-like isoform X2 [Patiria miniata]